MVDGLDQNSRGDRDTFVVWEPERARSITNDDFDYAEGVYDSGYGPSNAVAVNHVRQVVFVKPGYWLVIDTMRPADGAEHEYEAMFHLDAEDATADPKDRSVTVEYDAAAFRIIPVSPEEFGVQVIQGQEEPTVQGWLPTGRHNELRPIPTAVFRWQAAGPSVMAYALVPRAKNQEWPVRLAQADVNTGPGSLAARILLPGGAEDLVVCQEPNSGEALIGPLETDAELALMRIDQSGAALKVLQIGGSGVTLRAGEPRQD